MTRVSLGGVEVDDALLGDAPAPLPEELRGLVETTDREGWGEPFDASGPWRLLVQEGDRAEVGAPSDTWDGWVLMHLERTGGTWRVRGTSYGQVPGPTRADRSQGLRLAVDEEPVVVRRGARWDLRVRLVNDREELVEDLLSPFAFGYLEDDGGPLPQVDTLGIADTGLEVRLRPGASVELSVVLFTEHPDRLPAGEYLLHVSARDLELQLTTTLLVR